MPDRKHFHELAMERLQETRLLILNGRYTGARYLSGYIIEAALKSRICKILDSEYPETGEISKSFLTHKFDLLIKLGGLQKLLDEEKQKTLNLQQTGRYFPAGRNLTGTIKLTPLLSLSWKKF